MKDIRKSGPLHRLLPNDSIKTFFGKNVFLLKKHNNNKNLFDGGAGGVVHIASMQKF